MTVTLYCASGQGEPQPQKRDGSTKLIEKIDKDPVALPITADWRARAMKWFESDDSKARRKEMRKATRALKQPCRYCHTPDFKGYTEKRLISQQMMALSVEHGVECQDCHAGKDQYTEMGKTAQKMWSLSRKENLFCDGCHTQGTAFKSLTEHGRRFKESGEN